MQMIREDILPLNLELVKIQLDYAEKKELNIQIRLNFIEKKKGK